MLVPFPSHSPLQVPVVPLPARGVSMSPPSCTYGSLSCPLQGGGWTVSPSHHSPSSCVTEPVFPLPFAHFPQGSDGFWRLQQSHRKYHRLQGFLWVLAVSHLSRQEEKRGEVIHPTPESQAKTHQGGSQASGSQSNLPCSDPGSRLWGLTHIPHPAGSDPRGLVPHHSGPSLLSVH